MSLGISRGLFVLTLQSAPETFAERWRVSKFGCQDAFSERKSTERPHISSPVFSLSRAMRSDSYSSGCDLLHG